MTSAQRSRESCEGLGSFERILSERQVGLVGRARNGAPRIASGVAVKGRAARIPGSFPVIGLRRTLVVLSVLKVIAVLQALPHATGPALVVVVAGRIRIVRLRELAAPVRGLLAVVFPSVFCALLRVVVALACPVE